MKRTGILPRIATLALATAFFFATFLFLGACSKNTKITGPWHNEKLIQLIEFKEGGSFTFRSGAASYDGIYVYDESKGQGTLVLNGATMAFTASGDTLQLGSDSGVKTDFVRGPMAIAVITATPKPSAAATATPATTPTSPPASTPSTSMGIVTFPPLLTFKPLITFLPGDVIGTILYGEVAGSWRNAGIGSVLTLKNDGTCTYKYGTVTNTGTYTYNPSANTGTIQQGTSDTVPFTYDAITDRITIQTSPSTTLVFTRLP